MGNNPYFDPKSLLGLGKEPKKLRSRWEFELDGFDTAELGRSERVGVLGSTNAGAFKELARVQVAPEAARDWVITLSPLSPGNQGGPYHINNATYIPPNVLDAAAVVQWSGGQQGAASWAIVDWWAGQQFSVYGSAVRVSGAVIVLADASGAINDTHLIAAQIAPGFSRNVPRRTIQYAEVIAANGGSDVQPVPPFATSFSLSSTATAGFGSNDIEVTGELTSGGAPIWRYRPLLSGSVNTTMNDNVRLPIGSNFIEVENRDPTIPLGEVRLLYDLALS